MKQYDRLEAMKNQIADRESSPMRSLERALHILTILEEPAKLAP